QAELAPAHGAGAITVFAVEVVAAFAAGGDTVAAAVGAFDGAVLAGGFAQVGLPLRVGEWIEPAHGQSSPGKVAATRTAAACQSSTPPVPGCWPAYAGAPDRGTGSSRNT